MALVREKILTKWTKQYKKHYENKGYIFTKLGDKFEIDVIDLPHNSTVCVNVLCDHCGKIIKMRYMLYSQNYKEDEYCCAKCRDIKLSSYSKKNNLKIPKAAKKTLFDNNKIKKQNIFDYIVNDTDKNRFSRYSKEIIECRCPDCGAIKKYRMSSLYENGFCCSRCGDGFSYPNKFAFSFFEQLNVSFIPEYRPDWAFGRRYDFYFMLDGKECVVEMDGEFHYSGNPLSGMTKEEATRIDDEKDKYAAENNVHMIRVNSRKSTIEHIKKYILRSNLNKLFDLSNIDWIKCGEYASHSILIKICELWNEQNSVSQICEIAKINRSTVWRYIIRGKELGKCNYDPTIARQVICRNTKEIFDNCRDAAKKYNISVVGNITANCKGRGKSAGKHPITGESLVWMFYDEYLKLSPEEQDKLPELRSKTCNTSGVICLNTLEVFEKATQAAKFYNISPGNITVNAQGKINYAGTLPDGTPLRWMYHDEYLEKQLGA